jgi:hypothetical protein
MTSSIFANYDPRGNQVSPQVPAYPTPIILAQSAVAVSLTGTTAETALASIPIPAGLIGKNGTIRIFALFTYTNSANAKTMNAKLGGQLLFSNSSSTTVSQQPIIITHNRNSLSSQITSNSSSGATTASPNATTVDTSVDQVLQLTGTLASSGETITLESYTVEILPG